MKEEYYEKRRKKRSPDSGVMYIYVRAVFISETDGPFYQYLFAVGVLCGTYVMCAVLDLPPTASAGQWGYENVAGASCVWKEA